jgi:hypothetical protein
MDELKTLTGRIAQAVFSSYRVEYVEKCLREEPQSFLALARGLETAKDDELLSASNAVIDRVLLVYRPELIDKCVREQPDSLLALVMRLKAVISERQRS